jgi:phosphatidylglycerophosphate synthase
MDEQSYQPGDRRPIASRNLAISRQIAHTLAASGVTANSISLFGMFSAIAGGVALYGTSLPGGPARILWVLAAACAQVRLLANMFDGMVAIEQKTASPLGELFNEVPDRISDSAMFIGLGYAAGGNAAFGWLAALLAIFTAYVRAVGKVAGAPQDFSGPMAKPQRPLLLR